MKSKVLRTEPGVKNEVIMKKKITDQHHTMLRVARRQIDNDRFATLFFNHSIDFKPGQFVMAWIPGLDEKPYTVSVHDSSQFAITIEAKGLFSKKAVRLEPGDLMGFRGPFGNGFNPA
jgi:dihydroorotate dehydrogenase electron transfer subunit